jgi:predicted nucleic acid-binding protein
VSTIVLDSSVGVKWLRDEPGSAQARDLLVAHGRGQTVIVVPSLFVYELFGVASRELAGDELGELWERFLTWRIRVREMDATLMPAAIDAQRRLGCSLYDAFAPAVAEQTDATLYSADERAHGRWPGVVLVG